MLTAMVLVLSVALILAGGETVRGQCRRMLSRPIAGTHDETEAAPAQATA